jgi:pimeloyl-ACP methyl ester carboxylesterase
MQSLSEAKSSQLDVQQHTNWFGGPIPAFKFAMLISGSKPRAADLQWYYEQPIKVPSLHVYGMGDDLVTPDKSEALSKAFTNATVVTHPGGHYLPITKDYATQYKAFFAQFTPTQE